MDFPSGQLLFITLGYVVSMLITFGFGLFVMLQKGASDAHRAFMLMCLSLAGFQLSFILGTNTADPDLAYWFWYANLIDIFMAIFYLHFIILALDALPRFRKLLYADYAVGLTILAASFAFPHLFLPTVEPKLYFENYLVGGPLYIVMLVFFLSTFLLSFLVMFLERVRQGEEGQRRIGFYVFSLFYGFASGITAFPLVFGFTFDPVPSIFIGAFVIPMVYGMIKKDLLDIRLVVRRTILFAIAVALITGLITAISLLSQHLAPLIPGYFYFIPLIAALAATAAGAMYIDKANEAEKVKYEFLTVVAHKFRTPLTRIRWASEALREDKGLSEDAKRLVSQIREADLSLIQLSNLLIDTVRTEKQTFAYVEKDISLLPIVKEALETYSSYAKEKQLDIALDAQDDIPLVYADAQRLSSAVSVLIENAIAYTPKGGTVRVTLTSSPGEVRLSVKDSGIGINAEEMRHIFKKFYRGEEARRADTEGVGVGLNMTKTIVERERGSIGVDSGGRGRGSEFWITLPPSKRAKA